MSGVHKNPTISFRISDYERREIEARDVYKRQIIVYKADTVMMHTKAIAA